MRERVLLWIALVALIIMCTVLTGNLIYRTVTNAPYDLSYREDIGYMTDVVYPVVYNFDNMYGHINWKAKRLGL
jgi:hypothetical protein